MAEENPTPKLWKQKQKQKNKKLQPAKGIETSEGTANAPTAEADSNSAEENPTPKPWKQKLNKKKLQPVESIEIFEGKASVPTGRLLEITPADPNGYVRIICREEAEFFVPVKVVEQLKCVDVILHGEVKFKEKVEKLIRFPEFREEVLESVMRFVFIEFIDDLKAKKYWGRNTPRVAFQFGLEPGDVMELVYAAHFFGIKNLLQVAASMIAHHLRDVPDVSSMPPDLAWCVAEQFSPQDLYYAEERPDFLSLSLQTSSLWEKHCRKLVQYESISIASLENYPRYNEWNFSEGPPPTSWKSLYMSVYLQQLADRQDGGSNDSFFEEVSRKGQWSYTHTIRSTFWQWVFTGEKNSLSLNSYAAQFPNLLSLCIAKVPLGDNSVLVGKFLQLMELLQLLDISETGFTKEAATALSESLRFHTRLQVLRAAYNRIGTEGYAAIARAAQHSTSLRVLDVRDNSIGYRVPEDAVVALRASALEELYFDGNFKAAQNISASRPIFATIPISLKFLQLQRCELKDSHLRMLARSLDGHSSIQKMDFFDNKITSNGASALFYWLQNNASLLELSFSENNITDSCSTLLCGVLQSHPSIEKLSLKGNYSYGEENLPQVISAALARGDRLLASKQKKFTLDLRSTDVSFANQARIQRQAANFVSLHLLI